MSSMVTRESPLCLCAGQPEAQLPLSLLLRVSLSKRDPAKLAPGVSILRPRINRHEHLHILVNSKLSGKVLRTLYFNPCPTPFPSFFLQKPHYCDFYTVFLYSCHSQAPAFSSASTHHPPHTHIVYKGKMDFALPRAPWNAFSLPLWRS